MAVTKLKDGRWIAYWQDKETKKIKRKYFGRDLDAKTKAYEFNESLGLNTYVKSEKRQESVFFDELFNAYIESKSGELSPTTIKQLMIKADAVYLPELGQTNALRINAARLDKYVVKRLKTVKRTTVHRELADILAILSWAASSTRKLIPYNPAAGYRKPKKDDAAIITPPTDREIKLIIAHAKPHLIRALMLSYYTGMRPGQQELFKLRWVNVFLDENFIEVISAKKGGLPYRTIPIHPDFRSFLTSWKRADDKEFKRRNKKRILAGKDPFDYIIHFQGKSVRSVKTTYAHAKKQAGITRKLPPYSFRHAFVSYMLKQHADLKAVSEMAGHSRPDTTLRIYQHTDLEMHQDNLKRLPGLKVKKPAGIRVRSKNKSRASKNPG
jgi:integrase